MPANNLFERGKLEQAGVLVSPVHSTHAAIDALVADDYDVVITDMQRHEKGRTKHEAGIELIEWIRDRERKENRRPKPVYLYCSAWAIENLGQRAVESGATGATASTTELLTWVLGQPNVDVAEPVVAGVDHGN